MSGRPGSFGSPGGRGSLGRDEGMLDDVEAAGDRRERGISGGWIVVFIDEPAREQSGLPLEGPDGLVSLAKGGFGDPQNAAPGEDQPPFRHAGSHRQGLTLGEMAARAPLARPGEDGPDPEDVVGRLVELQEIETGVQSGFE